MNLFHPSQLLPLALSVNTIVLMWLVGNRNVLGWVMGLAGQVGWYAFIALFDAWGLLPMTLALTAVYARNLVKWARSDVTDGLDGSDGREDR